MAVVYRLYDKDYALLYVGASSNVAQRFKKHQRQRGWFKDTHRIELQHFDTRGAAYRAESIAIVQEKPLHNPRGSLFRDDLDEKTRARRDRAYQLTKAKDQRRRLRGERSRLI